MRTDLEQRIRDALDEDARRAPLANRPAPPLPPGSVPSPLAS